MISQIEGYLSPSAQVQENKRRIAGIVQNISYALLVASALAGIISVFNSNWDAAWALLILTLPLTATIWLSRRGQASTAIFILACTLLVLTTVVATQGQGIHDIANFVYPGILIVSSLALNRRAFFMLTIVSLAAIGWLVFGAMFGLFVPRPHSVGDLSDFMTVSVILITTSFCVYLLVNNLQQSLEWANKEMLERQQAEHALRESQTMLQLIFDHAFDGISIYEELPEQNDRRLINCNTRYAEMAGRSKEELLAIGRALSIQKSVSGPRDRAEFVERLNQGVYTGRFSWLRPDGRDNIIEYAAVPLHIGDRLLVIGVDRDITAQVQAAQEREAMIKELEAKNAELERFTYTVSHDLKSPLITIKGFLGFLEQDALAGQAERMRSDMAHLNSAADKMQQLLDELLELSRIGRLTNPSESVSMTELAHEAAELVAGQLTARGVRVDIATGMPIVVGDRPRLREVYENLLSNAAKFMGDQPHPRVEVGMREEAGQPVFTVHDNGIGIAPQDQDKIFELFERLDSRSEGTGIGLTIVKRIVETHGGKIWIESEGKGRGTTFCFTLG